MKSIQIKQRLIDRINETTDNSLLEELYRILNQENDETAVYTLSEEQKKALQKPREDFKEGRIMSDKQANSEIEEWLKK